MPGAFVSTDRIRSLFTDAMSQMYRTEVPQYGALIELVGQVNAEVLARDQELSERLRHAGELERIDVERHGAIRLGTAEELFTIRRLFAVMGMQSVGYYDLSVAGVPVHSTCFRPVEEKALNINPFRVFTSLLRLELIEDEELRAEAAAILARRRVYTPRAIALIEQNEKAGGLTEAEAAEFVAEALETFRWHGEATVSAETYKRLHDAHRLIADVVSFKGPHINHLTPRTLDIDEVQRRMPERGITPKAVIEGPPRRNCDILLRQTSFKALEEPIAFTGEAGTRSGTHTARFGEIEQRGIALTPKGRGLYDQLLEQSRKVVRPAADGSNADAYEAALAATFEAFPDDWATIRTEGLGYFSYSLTEKGMKASTDAADIETLVSDGLVQFDPIVYEDFLPVSAAGIFQSNLGDGAQQEFVASPNQQRFETDLGAKVLNEFDHYAGIEQASIDECLSRLSRRPAAQ